MAELISKESVKTITTEDAMNEFAQEDDVVLVHSNILYRFYTIYNNDRYVIEDRPRFFRKVGMYLYYERFVCEHGDEYYYYIKFNEDSYFYREHKDLIRLLITATNPSTLTDYIGDKDLSIYKPKE